jgi:ABC-type transport system involved in multi-copper enzyme maturation permease subunit
MREMVRRFLRQKFGNLGIVLALAVIALLAMVSFVSQGSGGAAGLAVLVLSAGSVSKDASSGALQMILARPIHRSEYLFGRYLGILSAYAVFLLFTFFLAITLPRLIALLFNQTGPYPPLIPLLRVAAAAWLSGTLVAATLLFFSTFLPGFGDVLAFILLQFSFGIGSVLGGRFAAVDKAVTIARENLMPDVAWNQVFRGEGLLGEATGRFVLALTVFLIAAALVFSRREFSYGQE